MNNHQSPSFEQRIQQIESLVEQLEQSSDASTRNAARSIVQALLDLHAAGFGKLIRFCRENGAAGSALLDTWTSDELVASLLLLHGLHPDGIEARVGRALEQVRPYLQSHGGDVDLLEIRDGTVRLQLNGSCQGCPSSNATMTHMIERAIYESAPDVVAIEVEGAHENSAPARVVQLEVLKTGT